MGKTKSRQYDRYTLEFKRQAVRLANHPGVIAKHIAEALGIHVVLLYRWRGEEKRGHLREPQRMVKKKKSAKRRANRTDPMVEQDEELKKAKRRIKQLEKQLATRTEELDILKKAERFFAKTKR